jgi:hypothetical protein
MANDEPAEQEHFAQIPEGQPIAQTAENHEADDVARKGRPVQHSVTALVELPTAIPAAKPPVAPSRDLTTLRNRRRATADTIHLEIRTAPAASSPTNFAAEVKPPPGARPDRTDKVIPPAVHAFMAQRADAKVIIVATDAYHLVMVFRPTVAADFIEKAAAVTRGKLMPHAGDLASKSQSDWLGRRFPGAL